MKPCISLFSRSLLCLAVAFASLGSLAAAHTFKRGQNLSHWLSQNSANLPYAADWFTEADVKWIETQGFDHIRITVDGRVWLKADGTLDEAKLKPFEKLLGWIKDTKLGAVLDMHFLPGADFNNDTRDTRVFTDEKVRATVAEFWRKVAKRYAGEGEYLRFEILNEPVAEKNEQLNPFNRAMLAAIRESNPTRIVYVTSNRWSSFKTVKDVEVPEDPNIAITVHFYEPHTFTHQRASWVQAPADMPIVPFPGKVPDLSKALPAGHHFLHDSGKEFTVKHEIDDAFTDLAKWAKKHAKGREIYVGEFGVYNVVPDEFRHNWITAVREACERHDFGWAVWDYKGGFATRGRDGEPTVILKALQGK